MAVPDRPDPSGSVGEEWLHVALAAAGTGTWRWNAATGAMQVDRTLEALSGLREGELGSTYEAWLDTVHPEDRAAVVAVIDDALERRGTHQFEYRTVWPDGTVRWLECRGEVLTDAHGEPTGTVGGTVDITARKLAELEQATLLDEVRGSAERLGRLQRISQRLTGSLTVDDVVTAVIQAIDPPTGANTRGVWLVDPTSGTLVLASHVGLDDRAVEMFERIDPSSDLPGALAVRERRTVLSPSEADSLERFPNLLDTPRTAEGFIAVPLVVENEALGVLAFGYDGPLDESDITFLEAVAGHVAQTLTRVRLGEALDRRSKEIELLAKITSAALTATDHRDLMRSIAAMAVQRLGDLCTIHFAPEPGSEIEIVAAHADPARAPWADELTRPVAQVPEDRAIGRVLLTGQAELIPRLEPATDVTTVQVDAGSEADTQRFIDELHLTSAMIVPVRLEDRTIGAMQVFAGEDRRAYDERDLALAQSIANGIGEPLHSRWLTDQHRHIAASLQRAFLPPALPSVSGLDVAAAYWPAGAASDVGGDFYDLFAIGPDQWAVLIGDACGTGPDAAATAAIARHTARAAARHGFGHREVLEWINQAVKYSDRDLFCTACYATIRVDADDPAITLTVSAGGHPLPIIVSGESARAVGAPGTLLGVFDDPRFELAETTLEVGEVAVFYTDGVTDLPAPYGRTGHELAALLAGRSTTTAAGVVHHIRVDLDERLSIHRRADDVALLVVRNAGTPGVGA
jgi:PAS domain S-box-containing protein